MRRAFSMVNGRWRMVGGETVVVAGDRSAFKRMLQPSLRRFGSHAYPRIQFLDRRSRLKGLSPANVHVLLVGVEYRQVLSVSVVIGW